jgi:hypothetical protein
LLRDVLKLLPGNTELKQAYKFLGESQQIQLLASEQRPDGGWGAFHSRSTKSKQQIPSTEVGVERALSLGLDSSHTILQKTTNYILELMNGKIPFPDYQEKNDRWPTGMRLFLASTLSLIHPDHPNLNGDRKLWLEIAEDTFQEGEYHEEAEIKVHKGLTGASVKDSYLVLSSRYQLNVLGSIPGTLSRELETSILRWLWKRPDGIGYFNMPLHREPPNKPGLVDRWLASLELLARLFPSWVTFSGSNIAWLWECQNDRGYWDFGSKPSSVSNLPLSDSWRKSSDREFDWTTRILILLRQYYDE